MKPWDIGLRILAANCAIYWRAVEQLVTVATWPVKAGRK